MKNIISDRMRTAEIANQHLQATRDDVFIASRAPMARVPEVQRSVTA